MKLHHLLFDLLLMSQQTNTCKGSSSTLKFDICSCFSVQVCRFSLLLGVTFDAFRRTSDQVWNYTISSSISHQRYNKWTLIKGAQLHWNLIAPIFLSS
jgi:hypothetical protein